MEIRLRYFASLREALGTSHETLTVPEQVASVGQLRVWLRERGANWADALDESRALRTACNQSMCNGATLLAEGSEIAFFPPVTGG